VNLTFELALELTDTIGGRAAYEIEALRGLWTALSLLESMSTIVEVGCEYGRSTSLIAQVAKEQRHRLILVDPFVDKTSGPRLMEMLLNVGYPFSLYCMSTLDAGLLGLLPYELDFVHVDGDHSTDGIQVDCAWLLPRLNSGGVAVFHDYGHDSLPDVKPVVDEFTRGWEVIGTWHTCHVLRKP